MSSYRHARISGTIDTNWNCGKFKMAEKSFRRPCEDGKNYYLFDLAGDDVKWKTISLFHVEYPEGNTTLFIWKFASPGDSKE